MDEQLYETCASRSPRVSIAVLSQADEQSGPITASTGPSCNIAVNAFMAAGGLQGICFHENVSSFPPNMLSAFTVSTAREMAPTAALPSGQ